MRNHACLFPIGMLACITLLSCEKKIKSNQPPANVLTDERATGKWEAIAFHVIDYREDTLFHTSEYFKDFGQVEDNVQVQGWVAQYHTTYLTLQSDHNFFHVDYDGNFNGHMLAWFLPDQGGTWAVKSQDQLELTTLSFAPGHALKQVTWDVTLYDGHYMNIETTETYTEYGAKAVTKSLLEFERQ